MAASTRLHAEKSLTQLAVFSSGFAGGSGAKELAGRLAADAELTQKSSLSPFQQLLQHATLQQAAKAQLNHGK